MMYVSRIKSVKEVEMDILYSGIRACRLHPFNCLERFICKPKIGYDDPSDQEESSQHTAQLAGLQKRYLLMSSLARLLVANREVVTLYYNFDPGSQLFVTCNHTDSIDKIVQHLKTIISCIQNLIKLMATNPTEEQVDNWVEDLSRQIVKYASKKLERRLDDLMEMEGMKSLDWFAKVSECKKKGFLGGACSVIAQHMTPEFTETVKNKDSRLHRRLLKIGDYVRFGLLVSKMCKQAKYRVALASITESKIVSSKDSPTKTSVLTYEKTISAFAAKLDAGESADKYRHLVLSMEDKAKDVSIMNKTDVCKVALHSELQMLHLLQREGLIRRQKRTILFVSKLCCALCYNHIRTINTIDGLNVIVEGTNGKVFDGWKVPEGRTGKQAAEYFVTGVLKKQFRRFRAEDACSDTNSVTSAVSPAQDLGGPKKVYSF
ncbi:hypothetical protein HDV05_001706 [Chytridiales sp. JEL 0842]|nr:hypothetical protein HDV05_001706 [Chytridiales sp. JEL 0842]